MESKKNGSDKNVGSIEKDIERCEQLTKPEHANWIGLSNQLAIEHLIKAYKEEKERDKERKKRIGFLETKLFNLRQQVKLLQAHRLRKYMMDNYIEKTKIKEIRDKAEVMDYYTLSDVIDDLNKLLKGE